jgi:hypothetical protein
LRRITSASHINFYCKHLTDGSTVESLGFFHDPQLGYSERHLSTTRFMVSNPLLLFATTIIVSPLRFATLFRYVAAEHLHVHRPQATPCSIGPQLSSTQTYLYSPLATSDHSQFASSKEKYFAYRVESHILLKKHNYQRR